MRLRRPQPNRLLLKQSGREMCCAPAWSRGFTLIEIMVAIGVIAIIMTISIPFLFQEMHKDGMRKALADIQTLCDDARRYAVEHGVVTVLHIRPGDKSMSLSAGSAVENTTGSSAIDTVAAAEHAGGGSSIGGSIKIPDNVLLEYIEVDLQPDLQQYEDVSAYFYPNGTSSALAMVLRSDRGEVRKVLMDVVTGTVQIEVER